MKVTGVTKALTFEPLALKGERVGVTKTKKS